MPALAQLAEQVETLLCVYVIDEDWFTENAYGYKNVGEHRWRFTCEGLKCLDSQLKEYGNKLVILKGKSAKTISELIQHYGISHLGLSEHQGPYEIKDLEQIKKDHPDLHVVVSGANYLYTLDDFPFSLDSMTDNFSPFRRKVEKYCEPHGECIHIDKLPPPLAIQGFEDSANEVMRNAGSAKSNPVSQLTGGEKSALDQLEHYFYDTDNIARYKETRNGMLGWDYSSKFSAWLAAGHISPRTILANLKHYEEERVSNDSTYWLFFELLWREFFSWQLKKHGSAFFRWEGIQQKAPTTKLDTHKLRAWEQGETGYEIVDACMHELNQTGFMSNRGRQLVASCFVHELNLDWRYGAAYFEQQLIDFDVASNYGNWQYLAGVGSDPRGHRQFNLAKQTQQYDGNGVFRNAWLT
jgi:deoxyribodipyrimidine photo-lyase